MAFRKRISRRASRKSFRRGAKSSRRNLRAKVPRGGIRM